MRTASALALLGLVVAPHAVAAQTPAARGAFVMRIGADTVVIERFERTADTLVGTISVKGQPQQQYLAVLAPANTVASISLNLFTSDAPGAAPAQRMFVVIRGDTAITNLNGEVRRFATLAGATPLLNNSFALAELFSRRARVAGGSATIPVFAVAGGVSLTLSLRAVGPDSMLLTLAGVEERLQVNGSGQILGGTIPAQHIELSRVDGVAATLLRMGKVSYAAPTGAPYTATEVILNAPGGFNLGGTLTLPIGAKGPVPAIVTITGSGQQDRDEYIPVAGGYRPFRQIADTLGRRGIAVLRLDDRMVGLSGGTLGTSADYADDIRAALAFLRTRPEIDPDRLALLGHSEGGMIAPMVAVTDPRLKGIVLMAGPSDKGVDILHYQQRNAINADTSIRAAARDSIARVAAVSLDSIARTNPWMAYFLAYDPIATARQVKVPTLILQGATDHQITPEQAGKLGRAIRSGGNRDVTVQVFPAMNHLFIPDSSGNVGGYNMLKTNRIPPEVLGVIVEWLVKRLGR